MVPTARDVRYFPFLEPEEEIALLDAASTRSLKRNQRVFDQGALLRAMYLIERGSVRIERQERDRTITLAILAAGEFFGEMSFVDSEPTSARVVADEPTLLRIIDEAAVTGLNAKDPSFAARFYRSIAAILVARLRLTSMHLSIDQSWH